MKICLYFLILICLSWGAKADLLSNNLPNSNIPSTVADALKKAGIPQSNAAIYVQDLELNNVSASLNADKSFNPASVMKLVTSNAALDLLGPTYRWKTEVYRNGSLNNGVLEGNLIFKGYGDPSFGAPEYWRLLTSLQQAGVHSIKGDLLIDKNYFAKNVGNRNTFDDETWRAYNAMPSAFLVNGRNTSFKFSPADNGVNISQEFELAEIQIINNMKLVSGACGEWRSRMAYSVKSSDANAIITFTGNYSTDCGERYLELSLFDDDRYAFFAFKKLWHQLGGTFTGKLINSATLPNSAVKIITQESEPLSYIIRDINKWSNNLMARQLLLTLAAEKNSVPALEANGAEVVKSWLNSKGFNFNELVIENGSGLSRIERISAAHLGQMLSSAYQSPVMPELMASLPILSQDGTVMKRLKGSPANGHAHLKTGSLDGVSAIAGYELDAQKHRHVLVMLVNHAKAAASKGAQDALIEWVYSKP